MCMSYYPAKAESPTLPRDPAMTTNRPIIVLGIRRSIPRTINTRHRRRVNNDSHGRGDRDRSGPTQHHRMTRRVRRRWSFPRCSGCIPIAARVGNSRRSIRSDFLVVKIAVLLFLGILLGLRGDRWIAHVGFQRLLVEAHRTGCVLRQRDHARIAPILRVIRGSVPIAPG